MSESIPQKKKKFDRNYVIIFILALVLAVIAGFYFGRLFIERPEIIQIPPTQNEVMCTMEAKICPDGSSVGRVGPNCEFTKCPGE